MHFCYATVTGRLVCSPFNLLTLFVIDQNGLVAAGQNALSSERRAHPQTLRRPENSNCRESAKNNWRTPTAMKTGKYGKQHCSGEGGAGKNGATPQICEDHKKFSQLRRNMSKKKWRTPKTDEEHHHGRPDGHAK